METAQPADGFLPNCVHPRYVNTLRGKNRKSYGFWAVLYQLPCSRGFVWMPSSLFTSYERPFQLMNECWFYIWKSLCGFIAKHFRSLCSNYFIKSSTRTIVFYLMAYRMEEEQKWVCDSLLQRISVWCRHNQTDISSFMIIPFIVEQWSNSRETKIVWKLFAERNNASSPAYPRERHLLRMSGEFLASHEWFCRIWTLFLIL